MDETTERIAAYTCDLRFGDLPPATVHQVKRVLVDTLGCLIGGYDSEPAGIARSLAAGVHPTAGATVLGSRATSSADLAAFAGGVAVRYLDCNDLYQTPLGGHPSDMIPAVLAAAEVAGADGKTAIAGIVAAYEVFGRLACLIPDAVPYQTGWDAGAFSVVGATCGVGKAMGLTAHQLMHAVSLAAVSNVPLFVTRVGHLSMWKGCVSASANRQAVFSAELARAGMTGPEAPFEGQFGVWQMLLGATPGLPALGGDQESVIDATRFKSFPAQGHIQGPIALALELRTQVAPQDIASIAVRTYGTAVTSAASPEKWDPHTRETADHSIPFLVAAALLDGTVGAATFLEARIAAGDVRDLMARMTVTADDDYTRRFPDELNAVVEIVTKDGRTLSAHTVWPKGDPHNPLSDADLEAKFHRLAGDVMPAPQRGAVLQAAWEFDHAPDLTRLIAALAFS